MAGPNNYDAPHNASIRSAQCEPVVNFGARFMKLRNLSELFDAADAGGGNGVAVGRRTGSRAGSPCATRLSCRLALVRAAGGRR
jgi:hypothetical protein